MHCMDGPHYMCVDKKQDCGRIKTQLLLERRGSKLLYDVQHLYVDSDLAKKNTGGVVLLIQVTQGP